jgi:hypothetical protein
MLGLNNALLTYHLVRVQVRSTYALEPTPPLKFKSHISSSFEIEIEITFPLGSTMLPTEIWELVVTHLDQNSLAQCSYVSSMFSHISSQLLYNFPMLPTASRFRSFAKELTPRNAKLVETIDLTNTARRWDTIRKNEITDLLTKCLSIKHLDLDMCYNL